MSLVLTLKALQMIWLSEAKSGSEEVWTGCILSVSFRHVHPIRLLSSLFPFDRFTLNAQLSGLSLCKNTRIYVQCLSIHSQSGGPHVGEGGMKYWQKMEKVEKIRMKVKQVCRQRLEIQKWHFSIVESWQKKRWVHTCHLLDRKGTTGTTDAAHHLLKLKAPSRVPHQQKNPNQEIHNCCCIQGEQPLHS